VFFVLCLVLTALCLVPGIAGAAGKSSSSAKPKVVKELTDLRTENSKTYLLSNGARQAEIYGAPIQFKDKSGNWKDIDTSLVASTDGSYVSAGTPVQVKLTKKDTGAPVVSLSYQGASVELAMKDLAFALPSVQGDTASYAIQDGTKGTPAETTTTKAPAGTSTTQAVSTTTRPDVTTDTLAALGADGAASEVPAASTTTDTAPEATTDTTAPALDTTTSETSTTETSTTETATTATIPDTAGETTTTQSAAAPAVSLSYQVLANGVKEAITLASPSSPNTFSFTLKHPGLILHQDPQGQWGFYDVWENPHPLLVLDAPVAHDSSTNQDGEPAYCPEPSMTVTPGTDESTVTLSLPESWLSDPARVYPVVLDPTVHSYDAAIDTFIESGYPNNSYWDLDHVSAGYFGGSDGWVTGLLKFTLDSDVTNGSVQSANLYLRQYYQSTGTAQVARVSAMTSYWIGSSTYASLGSKTWFGSDTVSINTGTGQSQDLNFNVAGIVQKWADGTLDNQGFTLYQSDNDHTANNWYRRVYSFNYGTAAYRPKLTITYTPQIDASLSPYNADKTGASDATSAIQSAINAAETAGGVVYIPAGNNKVSGLNLDHNHLTLRGSGSNTRLIVNSAAQAYTLKIGGSSAVTDVTVTNLYVRMPAGGDGIELSGTGGGSDITLTGLSLGGGADSSVDHAIVVGANFTDLNLTGNDLSGVTALPWDYSAAATPAALSGNSLYYQPYRSDFFGGVDRYDEAIRLSKAAFPSGVASGNAVVVALGTEYASVLSAGPLATAYSGPLLLNSSSSSLDNNVRDELERLRPGTIFLVGLPTAVYNAVKDNLPAATVTKLIGTSTTDDVGTGTAVATQLKTKKGAPTKALIIPYDDSTAGLASVVPLAAKNGWPILFTTKTGSLPSGTSTWATSNMTSPRSAIEVDTNVTITGTFTGTVTHIDSGGTDSAWALAAHVSGDAVNNCAYTYTGIAPSTSWADAALLGSYLGPSGGRLLLTDASGNLPTETVAALDYVALDYLAYADLPNLFVADENPGLWVPAAPRHTTYDLGSFADHSFEAVLDKSALGGDTTDLAIPSLGPLAALDRHYSSVQTSSGYFAPGWRFGFERSLDLSQESSGRIDYVDKQGDVYTFVGYTAPDDGLGLPVQTTWTAPPGFNGSLRKEAYSQWKLTLPGGDTLTFAGDGKIASEEDPNTNMTQYTWTTGGDPDQIYAQNGQHIDLTVANHQLTQASYTTTAGTRTVTYATASPWTVTYSYTGSPSTASHSLTYGYTSNLLTTLTANSYTSLGNSVETFAYTGGALTSVYYPDYVAGSNTDPRADIAYNGAQATITTHGRIYSTSVPTGETGSNGTVTQKFTWNPSGTMASKTNPKVGGSAATRPGLTPTPTSRITSSRRPLPLARPNTGPTTTGATWSRRPTS
jgi:hypothetical protein